ncbi:MAG: zinc ribbon domain-containing protein [Bacteroidales bacterium]|jgi:hypothetical protein|nr:zinc ribbon domain-containing protein [Bacteroidales bacterium]
METIKCTSCGETVLSIDKFCKHCGKPNEQKTETAVAAENPNKKYVLTFDALEQNMSEYLYSIEVDDIFIGKLKPGEKLETFVRKGTHSVTLKQGYITTFNYIFHRLLRGKKLETLVENNQIILLMYDRMWGIIKYCIADPTTREQQRKELKEMKIDKKEKGRMIVTLTASIIIVMSCFVLVMMLIILIIRG